MKFPTTILVANPSGNDLLTGGTFGIEASILTTISAVIISVITYILIKKKYKDLV